jgi:hypothetical protein
MRNVKYLRVVALEQSADEWQDFAPVAAENRIRGL